MDRRHLLIGRNPECIGHAIEESKQSCNVDRLGDLLLAPAVISQDLNILSGCAVSGFRDFRGVIKQGPLRRSELGLIQSSRSNSDNSPFICPLFTQGVGVSLQSIRATVEIRHPARDRFLGPASQMAFRKMDAIAHGNHVPQEVRPVAEAFQNPGCLRLA